VVGAILALAVRFAEQALARRAVAVVAFTWPAPETQRLATAPAPAVLHPLALRIAARGPPSWSC